VQVGALPAQPRQRPAHDPRLIIFLIDGLRPDTLAQANAPTMDELIAYGASTMTARTLIPSTTPPCIASLSSARPATLTPSRPTVRSLSEDSQKNSFPFCGST
jgi:hypothetical protein